MWFNAQNELLLNTVPVLWDSDHIVSRIDSPVDYTGIPGLYQKTQCGLTGHFYKFIDSSVKAGKVNMHYEADISSCFAALDRGDADYMTIEKSAWLNMLSPDMKAQYYLSTQAVDAFTCNVIASKNLENLLPPLNSMISSLIESPDWQKK